MYSTNSNIISDWIAIPLSRMTGTAELIVWGTVKTVKDSTFVFSVSKEVSGRMKDKTIEVLKVIPDKFASVKPPPYEKGQWFVLFLTRPKGITSNLPYKVMGIGGEGQMPVDGGYIYFPENNIEGLKFEDYKVNGVVQLLQRFDFLLFFNAVEEYGGCFKWTKNVSDNKDYPQKICDDLHIGNYSKKSFIHNFLTVQTQLMISKK